MRRPSCAQSQPLSLSCASFPPVLVVLVATLAIGSCKDVKSVEEPIRITPETVDLFVGGVQQFTALGAGRSASWSSADERVATVVAQTGFVQAVGRGSTTITATSGSRSASATVTVLAPPALALSEPALELAGVIGGADPAARTVTVSNAGDGAISNIAVGAIEWSEGQPTGWLTVSASGSSAPTTLTFTARLAGLPRGTYQAAVPVLANGVDNSPQYVSVTFRVLSPATLVLSRTAVSMQGIPGQTITETVNITNPGDVPLTGLAQTTTYGAGAQNWLTATLSATTAPATLTLTANTAGLQPGNYTATVRLSSGVAGVAPRDVTVQLTVNPGPSIVLGATSVATNATVGFNPAPLPVTVSNGGGGSLTGLSFGAVSYGAGQPTGWLDPVLSGTTAPATITLNFNSAALPLGTYTATVPVLSPVASNSPTSLAVTLTVSPAPSIVLSRTNVAMSGTPGSTHVETVQITSSSAAPLSGLSRTITYAAGQPQGWLTATLGSTTSPATLTLTGTTGSLAPGNYTATVTIASTIPGVTPRDVTVTMTVIAAATITLTPSTVSRTATFGISPSPSAVVVSNSGGGTLTGLGLGSVVYSGATGWLAPSLNSTTAPATITLTFNTAALATGSYSASVPVTSPVAGNSPLYLDVTVTVGAAPVLSLSPTGVNFSAWGAQSSLPGTQVVNVTSTGGSVSGLSTSIQVTGGGQVNWLTANLTATTTNTTLSIRPSRTNLPAGTHTAVVTVASSQPGVASKTVNVTYTIQTWTVHVYSFLNSCASGCHGVSQPNTSGTSSQVYNQLQPYFGMLQCKLTGPNVAPCTHTGGKLSAANQATLISWLSAGTPFF